MNYLSPCSKIGGEGRVSRQGRNPCQERVLAYATQGLSRGLGRPARIPTHFGRVGRVPSSRVPSPSPIPLSALLTYSLIPFTPAHPPPACFSLDGPEDEERNGSSLRGLAGRQFGAGLESPSPLLGLEPGPLQQGFLKILYLH